MRSYEISGRKSCELRSKCSINKKGKIKRWVDEAIFEAMARRVAENPEKIELSEVPSGASL
jgi:hypothetical protein